MPYPIRRVPLNSVNDTIADSYDLQAVSMFRGREVRKNKLLDDVQFGIHSDDEEHHDDSKALDSRRGELKVDLSKRETEAFSGHKESLPDFESFYRSKDFQKFMALLRRADHLGSYEDVLELLDGIFTDPTLKNAALQGALKLIHDQNPNPALEELLSNTLKQLLQEDGPSVRAGYNISQIAAQVGEAPQGASLTSLRDFYCHIVFGDLSLVLAYEYIMRSFPDDLEKVKRREQDDQDEEEERHEDPPEEEMEGEKGKKRLEKALKFLLQSLAKELKSNAPSIEHALLKKVMDGICEMEFFRDAYSSFLEMFKKMHEESPEVPVAPSHLMDELLKYISQGQVGNEDFLVMTEDFAIPPLQPSILFLTKVYQMIRLFPERVFPNNKSRTHFLEALQNALDVAIAQESEE